MSKTYIGEVISYAEDIGKTYRLRVSIHHGRRYLHIGEVKSVKDIFRLRVSIHHGRRYLHIGEVISVKDIFWSTKNATAFMNLLQINWSSKVHIG